MSRINFVTLLSLSVLALVFSEPAAPQDGIYIVVTPEGVHREMECELRAAQEPPVVEKDLIRFKVTVNGGQAPYHWKLPLYDTHNGVNKITVARVGKIRKPNRKGGFYIDVNIADIDKTANAKEIKIQLASKDNKEATCTMPAAPVRQLARATLPKVMMMNGSVGW